jgi:hypothetical protein
MIYTTHETYETLLMKHELQEWNITYATYETLFMPHMKHYQYSICNITNATYETLHVITT